MKMKPDASTYNPNPDYLRELIEKTGLTQRATARMIGVDERMFRSYLANREARSAATAPYSVQFCLEVLAETLGNEKNRIR